MTKEEIRMQCAMEALLTRRIAEEALLHVAMHSFDHTSVGFQGQFRASIQEHVDRLHEIAEALENV